MRFRERHRRNLQNEIRVRAKAQPDRPLTGRTHAIKAATIAQQIGDELEVKMGRPVAVDRVVTDGADLFAFADELTGVEIGQRFLAQMTVKRVKNECAISYGMV